MKKNLITLIRLVIISVVLLSFSNVKIYAANTPNITQVINSGALVSDIRDASRVSVSSPTFGLTSSGFSFNCQTTTGVLGSNTQRLYIDNPGVAINGWTMTIAATSGATSTWQNTGATQKFDFNDPTSSGCSDGADADTYAGQLTLNAAAGTLVTDCTSCTLTGITKGSSASFAESTLDSITLLNASSASDHAGRWYITGIGVSQTIPAEQAVDSYSINLTVTATAS